MGDEFVDVVETLDIFSVDWVVEGGVKSAKVVKVFESSPAFNFDTKQEEIKVTEQEAKELQEKVAKLEEEKLALTKQNEESGKKLREKELETYKSKKLSSIKDEGDREFVSESIHGEDEKSIDESFAKAINLLKKLNERKGVSSDIVINPIDKPENKGFSSVNEFMGSKDVEKTEKTKFLVELMK